MGCDAMRCDRKRAAVMVSLVASTFEKMMLAISGKNKLSGQLNGSLTISQCRNGGDLLPRMSKTRCQTIMAIVAIIEGFPCLRDRDNKYLL